MKFRLYKEFGALNSGPVFSAFEEGLKRLGLPTSNDAEAIPVIWSVLWRGKMFRNKEVYYNNIDQRPIIILEVGNLVRGTTWRISVNNVNRNGYFGNCNDLDFDRDKKINVKLCRPSVARKSEILITGQHEQSLQWDGQPSIHKWVVDTASEIRKYTDRKIYFRPHPRNLIRISDSNISTLFPNRSNSVENHDFDSNFHCIVNYNSGPGILSAIRGTPIIVDHSSLAFPVSDKIKNIDNPILPDRKEWFVQLCHTEWTIDEISQGIPLKRLLPKIERQ